MIVLPVAALAGCARPSGRIATALTEHGVERQQARCVGQELGTGLSLDQLRQLDKAVRAAGPSPAGSPLTGGRLLRVAASIEDPRIVLEVAKAVAGCGVLESVVRDPKR